MRYKSKGDVNWYARGRKAPIAYSTIAARDLINVLVEDHPNATISELKEMVTYDKEAKAVLQKYIDLGYGEEKI